MILDFFGLSIRASRFFRVLPKLRGMAICWGLESVLKPPADLHLGVKKPTMARKEDVFAVADFFEINTLHHWCKTPSVTETQRYGYMWGMEVVLDPTTEPP